MIYSIFFVLFWLICYFLSFGSIVAYFDDQDGEWPGTTKRYALAVACLFSLFGPFSLFVMWVHGDLFKHGWRLI
jgi:amino acid transporter